MADGENEKRPVRKLTVKNFSVIKEAELEFGKITVLIGPQASGKSLLCKLAYYFGQIVPEITNGLLLLRMSPGQLEETVESEFKSRFPVEAWGPKGFKISYESPEYCVTLTAESESRCKVEFSPGFIEQYQKWSELHGVEGSALEVIQALRTGTVGVAGPFHFDESVFIPTGRSFFSTPNRGFASIAGKNLDWITQRFASELDWEYRALVQVQAPSSDLLPQFQEEAEGVLNGRVVRDSGLLLFESERDRSRLPFQLLSSGTLELLPLLNPLANLVYNVSANPLSVWAKSSPALGPIFIEEPELSVFPETQYDLVQLFSWIAGEPRLGFSFVITTHSPYILSAFNNLIEAAQVASIRPEFKNDVDKLIPERYWVRTEDFRAYSIHGGNLESIIDRETGLISANYLDSVSETIGMEFDELLRLGYVES